MADLGSASLKGRVCPRDDKHFAGDPSYAPPELLYGYLDPDWAKRRLGCDAYLLGSMIVFMFTGLSFTGLLLSKMSAEHHPRNWTGSYKEVLPYLQDAFGLALQSFASTLAVLSAPPELTELVKFLCEPDLSFRGHPQNRIGHVARLSLERFVSRLDLLALRAEYSLR